MTIDDIVFTYTNTPAKPEDPTLFSENSQDWFSWFKRGLDNVEADYLVGWQHNSDVEYVNFVIMQNSRRWLAARIQIVVSLTSNKAAVNMWFDTSKSLSGTPQRSVSINADMTTLTDDQVKSLNTHIYDLLTHIMSN